MTHLMNITMTFRLFLFFFISLFFSDCPTVRDMTDRQQLHRQLGCADEKRMLWMMIL